MNKDILIEMMYLIKTIVLFMKNDWKKSLLKVYIDHIDKKLEQLDE